MVGGGPGGIGAAISAARRGAETVLIERYGHLGGMATGGLVNIIPNLSDWNGKQHIFGISQEIIDRLERRGATSYPETTDWGTTDRRAVDYYLDANLGFFYVRKDLTSNARECSTQRSWTRRCSKTSSTTWSVRLGSSCSSTRGAPGP